jgi:hypothetical protein
MMTMMYTIRAIKHNVKVNIVIYLIVVTQSRTGRLPVDRDQWLKANRDEVLVRFSVNRWRGIYLAVFS